MPLWLVSEFGYGLALAGFLLLILEWRYVFHIQGNSVARRSLRDYLAAWREQTDEKQRAAIVEKMRQTVAEFRGTDDPPLYRGYVEQLKRLNQANTFHLDNLDRAFDVGSPIEEGRKRGKRCWLVAFAVLLVILGTAGQMIGTLPEPIGPFCKSTGWWC